MKISPAFLCLLLIGCGNAQTIPADTDATIESSTDTIDFSNHAGVEDPFAEFGVIVDKHLPLTLKVNVAGESSQTLYIDWIDSVI